MGIFSKLLSTRESISIVIPLFNHEKYITEALASVINQSVPVDEIIVIDDGSSDHSFEVATKVLEGLSNVIIQKQSNQGAHATLNRAISLATSEWIGVLNSDDFFDVTKIENFMTSLQKFPEITAYAGRVTLVDSTSKLLSSGVTADWIARATNWALEEPDLRISLVRENFLATTSNVIFRKSVWSGNGPFRPLRYCHDIELFLRLARNHSFLVDIEDSTVFYRSHSSNTISESLNPILEELSAVLADHFWEISNQLNKPQQTLNQCWTSIKLRGLQYKVLKKLYLRSKYNESDLFFTELLEKKTQRLKNYSFFRIARLSGQIFIALIHSSILYRFQKKSKLLSE